jgi:hypothetical protein
VARSWQPGATIRQCNPRRSQLFSGEESRDCGSTSDPFSDTPPSHSAAYPDRFARFASAAPQHPDLAARQLEDARTKHNMRGAAIGCSVEGRELRSEVGSVLGGRAGARDAAVHAQPQDSVDSVEAIVTRYREFCIGNAPGGSVSVLNASANLHPGRNRMLIWRPPAISRNH